MKQKTLKVKPLDTEAGKHTVLIHSKDARSIGLKMGDRVEISLSEDRKIVTNVNLTKSLIKKGQIGTYKSVTENLGLKEGNSVYINHASPPKSEDYIQKMMKGSSLEDEEIHSIVEDIVSGKLDTIQMTALLVTQEIRGMSMEETAALTRSMIETGETVDIEKKPVMDVHSIGGVPGNKYSLITVPIVTAAGLTLPKTSSRAITSPAGTADIMEVLADVSFSLEEISEIVSKVGGVLAWGGAVNLAPADDLLINIERPLRIDPECQLLASVLSKKLAMSSEKILIDIPTGAGAKIEDNEEARDLAHDFISLGHGLDVEIETATTYGGQPLGYHAGSGLEAREAIKTLQGNGPTSLIEKATSLAGILIEMSGSASYGTGKEKALDILKSGKAYEKLLDIIEAQGGDRNVKVDDLPLGDKRETIKAPRDGYVQRIYNLSIRDIACAAGAPQDKGAGLKLFHKEGQEVKKGDPLIQIYAEHEKKLDDALTIAKRNPPFRIEGMLLNRFSGEPRSE